MAIEGNRAREVKKVLAAEWGMEPDRVPDDAALNRFDRWDSLGHIAIMLALAKHFQFELDPETVQGLQSIPEIVAFVDAHVARSPVTAS